jgi:Arrestin (or S-antigen), C-terminal domain
MFGKGKIDISIPKTDYAAGDSIAGVVTLTLKKPVQANGVSISLIGEQTVTHSASMGGSSQRSTTTEHIRIYDFKQKLDSEKEYSQANEYRFKIKIPADIMNMKPQMPELEDTLGQGLKIAEAAMAFAGALSLQRTRWYLLAKLDIPGGLDINEKADITIG